MNRLQFHHFASLLVAAFLASSGSRAEDAIKDPNYNLPSAVAATMGTDAVIEKLETSVMPEALAAFKQQHPAKFWLFGEDRGLAVRNSVIPAHWFEPGASNYQQFTGTARPGEFYVFQVCVVPGEGYPFVDCGVEFDALEGATPVVVSATHRSSALDPWWHVVFNDEGFPANQRNAVLPIWVGIQIPENAKPGAYPGKVRFRPGSRPSGVGGNEPFKEQLAFTLKVEGEPLKNSGVDDAWRLARLKWLNSTIGESDETVTRPFTPVKVDEAARTIDILGRRVTLGPNGIPAQITSFFSASNTKILATGRDAFRAPPQLDCLTGGKAAEWKVENFNLSAGPTGAAWNSFSSSGDLAFSVRGQLEFDGCLKLSMQLSNRKVGAGHDDAITVDDIHFTVPWQKGVAKYAMGLGLQGGLCPPSLDWKWDVKKHQDAIWMGDVNLGAMLRFKGKNFERPLINAYYDFRPLNLPESWGTGGIRIEQTADGTDLLAHSGPKKVTPIDKGTGGGLSFDIDWYLTPFKPLDTKQHFTDRYYHSNQGAALEDTAKLKAEGANILEIHHNRLCNPYINYPFNDDSFGHLQDFVKKAHADGMRVNLYYTTRELTQNLPEFFALKSMGGEIILPRKEGVAWPVTNPQGPHPWLKAHVGEDIVPAWRENLKFPEYPQKLDLAVITTPDSRWNNFYLEGLDYLIKNAGIDGLYIDDTALDRSSMQRARRILDADGNPGRRVSMHSWNHYNDLAKWSNSSIAFMELYPYYDGLWHGEGFNANASPEYMLIEMSGIPYGLMSEMLDHPNPWHGMVFGMRTRWPWSGDPRPLWKLEDAFGIAGAEYIGWWNPACPIKTGHPEIKASVYRKVGSTLIALASWAKETVAVKLEIDWKALGLDPAKTTLRAPACAGFQPESAILPDIGLPVEPGKGWLMIAEEKPPGTGKP